MIRAASFIEHLTASGYSHYTGVPCSYLKSFINYVIDSSTLSYVGAASEGEAVGISIGAYLAGSKTVTMCQNSGFGNMVNPLTSLNYPMRVPTLLIVTWRGEPGLKDEPQHEQMGRITTALLDTLEIPWAPFPTDELQIARVVADAEAEMNLTQRPFALVMSEDSVASYEIGGPPHRELVKADRRIFGWSDAADRLTRTEALNLILDTMNGDEAIIATTGKTGRELFSIADRPGHLYVVGGMGTASAIGLGVARAIPDQPVVVIDGDGAALMKLGSMATIGYCQPKKLLHIVLDNEAYDSTGGQVTSSSVTRFADVAAAANYRNAFAADDRDTLRQCLKDLLDRDGPSLLHMKIQPGSPSKLMRPTVKPHDVKDRFMSFLANHERARGPRADALQADPAGH